MAKKIITSENAPKAIGPYSVAVQIGKLVFTSGQLGIDPKTGELVDGGIEAQTQQCLTNIKHVLADSGIGLDAVIKTTVFLKDMNDFQKMNGIYAGFFPQDPPARSAVQVAALPKGGLVEIETIASME